jgi:hypothetical protein
MNEIDVRAKFPRDANRLGVAAGIVIEKDHVRISHD